MGIEDDCTFVIPGPRHQQGGPSIFAVAGNRQGKVTRDEFRDL
jgi:hypothetical protein